MVKDNTGNSVTLKLSLLSVSVGDLLDILKSKGISRIHAESGTYEFDSLEDMSANPGLLSGYPVITCDKVRIEMGKVTREIRSYGDRDSTVLARSIYADLIQRRGLVEKYAESKVFKFYIFLPIFALSASMPYLKFNWVADYNIGVLVSNAVSIYMLLAIFKFMIDYYCTFRRPPVRYSLREGFLSRHAEAIIVGTITAVLGAVAVPAVSWLARLLSVD